MKLTTINSHESSTCYFHARHIPRDFLAQWTDFENNCSFLSTSYLPLFLHFILMFPTAAHYPLSAIIMRAECCGTQALWRQISCFESRYAIKLIIWAIVIDQLGTSLTINRALFKALLQRYRKLSGWTNYLTGMQGISTSIHTTSKCWQSIGFMSVIYGLYVLEHLIQLLFVWCALAIDFLARWFPLFFSCGVLLSFPSP
jgi:hypothetical protein